MPAASMTAEPASFRPPRTRIAPGGGPVRHLPRDQVQTAAAVWAAQEAELDAEIAILEAAGAFPVPGEEAGPDPAPAPLGALPDGPWAWLVDLPGAPVDEHFAATTDATRPEGPQAGHRDRVTGDGAGFAADGASDVLPPGPELAGHVAGAHARGLSRLTDDELAGVIRAGRRLSSWASAVELAAVGDLMRRREAQEAAGCPHAAEHADAEIAALLTLTGHGAGRVLDLAMSLRRLPLTAQALAAGVIDVPRVAVIADETAGLSDDHTAAIERQILVRAPGQTTSRLRAATRRAVLSADPLAARRREEQARREARVERWDEHAGTAALAGRDLPPGEVIAADQHISALAQALRAAGREGTADQLRARVFLALLSGAPITSLLSASQHEPNPAASHSSAAADPGKPGDPAVPCAPRSDDAATTADADWPDIPPVAGLVNLTMPWGTWFGSLGSPGEVAGFGPLSAEDSRRLGLAMARHPKTRWCVTVTGADGRSVAHGCVGSAFPANVRSSPGPAPPISGPAPSQHGSTPPTSGPAPPQHGPAISEDGIAVDGAGVAAWLAGIPMEWFQSTDCAHQRRSAAYRPPAALRHLIGVRQQTCAFPGCRRPAAQCDLDHTTPFHRGGPTCECNLAPLCRKHHEAKQAPGWHLEHPRPGVLTWITPSGRRYSTEPTVYPS